MKPTWLALALLSGCGVLMQEPPPPTPLFEKGLVLPYDSLPCIPLGGAPQNDCNHHGSSVAELTDGTIAIAWFHGVEEKSVDSRIVWARKAPDAAIFAAPEVLYDDPARSEGNAVLWRHESGELFFFFVNIEGNGWAQARMRLMRSTDEGAHWTAPVTLSDNDCWMLRFPPVRLTSGALLLPGYYECLGTPTFVRSPDDFATWTLQETWKQGTWLLDHVGEIQPSVIVTGGSSISAVMRDGTNRHRVIRMTSDNEGRSWSKGIPTGLPNPGASVAQAKLSNGHVVVVFDNSPSSRAPLSAALSVDDGAHFTVVRDLVIDDCADDECSYPHVIAAKDGSLWVSYTHNRRTIGWVHINEAWLQQGTGEAKVICMANEVCAEERCFTACGDAGICDEGTCVDGACRTGCENDGACASG